MEYQETLTTYWYSFPSDERLPIGIGVTAYSRSDADALIEQQGINWHLTAKEVNVAENLTLSDLDQSNVVPNVGPMQFRGVWYPCRNIGYGAPTKTGYKPIK